ncbi:uncharacterized protein LOC121352870 [Pyrgilauda ruficollis]|uniref:uncharacterized protein LOC121352870 n=1 Tax=Pyrgilauda ruficollis TaxID=221976 RepID=UPI001B8716A7|nr:uncharacterized protein LOC121352870 [Pyrgilauda ruficollis]
MLGKGQAALEIQAPSPAKRKGEGAFPSSTVTLGDELSLRALCQPLLRSALVTVNKGHMLIGGQCVTSTAVLGYLATINQVTAMTYMSAARGWDLILLPLPSTQSAMLCAGPGATRQYRHCQHPPYECKHTTAPGTIAPLMPGHGAVHRFPPSPGAHGVSVHSPHRAGASAAREGREQHGALAAGHGRPASLARPLPRAQGHRGRRSSSTRRSVRLGPGLCPGPAAVSWPRGCSPCRWRGARQARTGTGNAASAVTRGPGGARPGGAPPPCDCK